MERARVLMRRNVVLGVIAGLLVALLAARPSPVTAARGEAALAPAFPGFDPANAAALELKARRSGVGKTVRLARKRGAAWSLASSFDYPAAPTKVAAFLDAIRDAKVKSSPTQNPEKFAGFAGDDGFTDVVVLDEKGETLASFGVGKTGVANVYSDTFVRVDDVAQAAAPAGAPGAAARGGSVVVATGLSSVVGKAEPTAWIETRVWSSLSSAEVRSIELDQREKARVVVLVKGPAKKAEPPAMGADAPPTPPATADTWTMTSPESGTAVQRGVEDLVRAFTGLLLDDVVAGAPTGDGAPWGFDKPEVVITARGRPAEQGGVPTWVLTIGAKVEGKDARYAKRSVDGHEDPFVFTVDDWGLREFRSDPSEWLEKPPEKVTDGPAMGDAPAMSDEPPTDPPAPREPGTGEPGMGEPGMGEPAMGDEPPPAPAMEGEDAPK